ncbi:MAG TPA: carboxypeptidase regulatory-like domain-containing protein [Thermoanaerobaculia bacterium]|jgi:hypothetical protein
MRHILALFLSLLSLPVFAAVTGSVMTSDGVPVPGARVLIHAIETPEARRTRLLSDKPDFVPLATVQTDAKGSFSLPSPKEPVVDIRVELRGYETLSRRVERDEDLGAILLSKREMQKGTVTAGGKPVANALVVVSFSGDYVTRTDEQGRYEAPEIKRARSITVIHPAYAIDEETFGFGGVAAGELNRTLSPGITLAGKAVAADGTTPASKAEISVDGWPLATSGEDGSFTIAHAPAKWQSLQARKDALVAQRVEGGDKTITLKLEKSAVVSGRVTDTKTKVPLAGVTVRLNMPMRMMARDSSPLALTDAKGVYSIPAPSGSYMVSATHPAYDMQSSEVSVVAGQQASKDLAMTQLARVSGVVVDEENRPVAAASVASEAVTTDMMRGPMRMQRDTPGISGPDGKFSIRVQGDSDIRLKANKKGLPLVKSEAMKLAAGERKGSVVLTIPTGVAVTGRALDANGDPLSGVSVVATETPAGDRSMRMIFMGMPGEEEDTVRSGSDGTFTLRVKEGTYDFAFKREGFAQKQVRAQNITPNGENTIEARLEPAVEISGRVTRGGVGIPDVRLNALGVTEATATTGPDGSFTVGNLLPGVTRLMLRKETDLISDMRTFTAPARDVVVEMPAGGTISGRVVEKGTKKPIASFQVGVSTSRAGGAGGFMTMGPPQLKAFTSDDGSFTLEHVPAGAMTLIANSPGYASGRMSVDVVDGKALTDVVLELDTGVRLSGKVTGANGAPLSDVRVAVTPSTTGAFAMRGSLPSGSTDANGEYSLDGLESGEENVQFSHPKHVDVTRKVALKGRETKLDVQLSAGNRVTGVVTTEDGMPVADADVSASSGMFPRETRTNASGTFEFDSMTPGRYRFSASKGGFATGVVDDVDVSSGSPVRITLKTGGTIYGRVTGLTEADYANTTVSAWAGRSSMSAAVDLQGNYRIEGAPLGSVRISASVSRGMNGGGRNTPSQTVEVTSGGAQQVNLEFSGNAVIRGRVLRNGVPQSGASVSFSPKQGGSQPSGSATTDEQGQYSISGLEPGEHTVWIRDFARGGSYNTTYTVRGSDTYDVEYKVGSVRGRVVSASTNEGIGGATVQLKPAATDFRGSSYGATADPNGNFVIELVPPGAYTVTAGGEGYANDVSEMTFGEAGRENLEFKLMGNEGVKVKIVDLRDGRALAGNVVAFNRGGGVAHDGRGSFRFGDSAPEDVTVPLPPGSYTATVSAFNYAPRSVTLTSPSTPTIALTPGGTIRLTSKHSQRRRYRLLDSTGTQYPRWEARPMPGFLMPGTFPLEHIAPGVYTLQLLNDDETVADRTQVLVREGETVDVSI